MTRPALSDDDGSERDLLRQRLRRQGGGTRGAQSTTVVGTLTQTMH